MQEPRAQAFFTLLIEQLVAVRPEIAGYPVTESSTVTGDLGMDSVDLAELFERIRGVFGEVDIADWLAAATGAEGDTVGSLTRYLASAVPSQAYAATTVGSVR